MSLRLIPVSVDTLFSLTILGAGLGIWFLSAAVSKP